MYVSSLLGLAGGCDGLKLGSDLYMVAVLPLVCAVYLGSTFPLPCPGFQYRPPGLEPTSIFSLVSTHMCTALGSL